MSSDPELSQYIRPGDTVAWGQACGEPRRLTRLLIEQADRIGPITGFTGIPVDSPVRGRLPPSLSLVSYCGTGSNAALHAAGRLRILPVDYSTLPEILRAGDLRADVVLVQVSPPDADGRYVLGLTDDYIGAAIDSARAVIAEVNPDVPPTAGATRVAAHRFATIVTADDPPAEFPAAPVDGVVTAIAANVAALVEDGATLQVGIGAIPAAALYALRGHRNLGLHSGMLPDQAVDLIVSGAVGPTGNGRSRGAVAGLLIGTRRLFEAAIACGIELRTTRYTHDLDVLASRPRFTAINSALEVDLTGRVNSESVGGRYLGAVGGSRDFLRGAARSAGGRAIVCLPAAARRVSRIVPRLSGPTTIGASAPITVVTEHGSADLAGLSPPQRIERMIAVAAPEHRAELAAAAERVLAGH